MKRFWWWLVCGVWLGALPSLGLWLFDKAAPGVGGAIERGYLLAFAGPVLGAAVAELMTAPKDDGWLHTLLIGLCWVMLPFSFVLLSAVAGNAPNLDPELKMFATRSMSWGCLLLAAGAMATVAAKERTEFR